MSTNIHFIGEREIRVLRTGKIEIQQNSFSAWQTPTKVTFEIMRSEDPFQAYRDWVLANSEDETYNVYADDDIFCENDPIGVEIRNTGKDHIKDFDDFLEGSAEIGFAVKPEAW